LTLGSRGDVQPFVALGRGLKAKGHTVTIATSASFEGFITGHGLEYGYLSNDLLDLMDTQEGRGAMEDTNGIFGTINTMRKLSQEGNRINRKLLGESWDAAQKVQPDLIIFHPKAFAAPHIAEKFNVPAIVAVMQPMLVSTTEMPPIGIPPMNLGGWYNKMGYGLIKMGYSAYKGMVNTYREETLGLGKLPGGTDIINATPGQKTSVMHAFSQHILPEPSDWDDHATVTGYWFLDAQDDWQPPDDLRDFLDAGDAPVYIGFGSMAGRDPERLTRTIIDAIKQAGVRAILASGWGGLAVDVLPESIFTIKRAPHDWLFQNVVAVVHHGGAGTTAAGLRAGRPTVICSFFGDQPFWGQQVHKMGVGTKHIPQKKLTTDNLAAAITESTQNQTMIASAKTLGEKIRAEDGIANAIAFIEKIAVRQ
ncbi:MAG: glycosyltransferase, partial [Aggregatilineales bacterium]